MTQPADETQSDGLNLLRSAERKLTSLNFWAKINWSLHSWCVSLALIGSIIVPFGLAALLYVPQAYARLLNISLLVISAISLTLQILNAHLHLAARAVRARKARKDLDLAMADFKDKAISRREFRERVEKVFACCAEEETA